MANSQLWNKSFYVEYDDRDYWKKSSNKIHFHLSYEIYFLVENDISYFINNRVYRVTPGTVLVIPPNTIHTTNSISDKTRKRYLINLPESYIKPLLDIQPNLLSDLSTLPIVFSGLKKIEITDLFKKLLTEYNSNPPDEVMIKSLLGELLVTVSRAAKSQSNASISARRSAQKMVRISNYIRDNLQNNLTLELLSEIFFLNPSYISRTFKRELNITFSEYLRTLRIKEACRLLKETKLSITEIAHRTGFQSCTDFCRVFKSMIKLSPLQYRKATK